MAPFSSSFLRRMSSTPSSGASSSSSPQVVPLLTPLSYSSSKWMVRKAHADAFGRAPATAIEIVGPTGEVDENKKAAGTDCGEADKSCGGAGKLEW